jgi:hypothetical protein
MQSSSGQLPSAIQINKNSHLYGKLYVCPGLNRRQSCPPGVKRRRRGGDRQKDAEHKRRGKGDTPTAPYQRSFGVSKC